MIMLGSREYYKWFAIIPGFIIGDLLGAASAFFLVQELIATKATVNAAQDNLEFELALLRICTLLIKADGVVDKVEVDTVRSFFVKMFGASKSNQIFRDHKASRNTYKLEELIEIIRNELDPNKFYSIIQMLFAIAAADGYISIEEERLIIKVGLKFGLSNDLIMNIKSQFIKSETKSKTYNATTIESLNVLGLKPGSPKDQIKTAYRKLAKEFHPDKLAGMSQGIQDLAKEKFQMIQQAYEYLNKNYV